MTGNKILTITQAAEMLQLSENTLRWMRHQGTGPRSFKVGRRIAYMETDIHEYVDAQIAKEEARLSAMKEARRA